MSIEEIKTYKENPNPVATVKYGDGEQTEFAFETVLIVGIIKGGKDDGAVFGQFVGHNSIKILEMIGAQALMKLVQAENQLMKGAENGTDTETE